MFSCIGISSGWAALSYVLNPGEIQEIQSFVTDSSQPLTKRLEVAKASVLFLADSRRTVEARKLVLEFISRAYPNVLTQTPTTIDKPPVTELIEIATSIDAGNTVTARSHIQQYLRGLNGKAPDGSAALIALKAEEMVVAYTALFDDLADAKVNAYSQYMLAVMATREKKLSTAHRILESLAGKIAIPRFQRWLSIDRAKFGIVTKRFEETHRILDDLLKADANFAPALYWKAFCYLVQGDQNNARMLLTQLKSIIPPNPGLLAETASLAMRLNELDTAAAILEKHEKAVEPTQEFYEVFYLVRKAQKRNEDATKYYQLASQTDRTPFGQIESIVPTQSLDALLDAAQKEKRQEIGKLKTDDPLAKVYLLLLEYDGEGALQELLKMTQGKSDIPLAWWVQSILQRRMGQYEQAYQTLLDLSKKHKMFRPYQTLASLGDMAVRAGEAEDAKKHYQNLQKQYPGSYQAAVAKRYLKSPGDDAKLRNDRVIQVSPILSRYANYSVPFVISEIMRHWDDPTSLPRVNSKLGASPRHALLFNEMMAAFLQGTNYRLVAFVGTPDLIAEFLDFNIPVVYCRGDMFRSQGIEQLSLIGGYDKQRQIVYAEGITPTARPILTGPELFEGICLAVFPLSLKPEFSALAQQSASFGEEYLALNAAAVLMHQKDNFDSKNFDGRRQTLPDETAVGYIPHMLSMYRYLSSHETKEAASAYLQKIENVSSITSQYWFFRASLQFSQNDIQGAQQYIQKALQLDPINIRYRLAESRILEQDGKSGEAIEKTEALLKQYPEDPIVSAHLLALYDKAGQTEKRDTEKARLKKLLKVESIKIDPNVGL